MTDLPSDNHGQQKLWTKSFILATTANFSISLVFYLLMPTMALYAVKQFNASDTASGLASSAFIIGAVFARVITGKFLDFVGRRRTVIITLVLYTLVALLYPLTDNATLFILIRALHGFGFGASATALTAAAMNMIPSTRRSEGTGYFGLSTTISTAVGPLLALWIIDVLDYDTLFYAAAAFGFIALGISLLVKYPEHTPDLAERRLLKDWAPRTFVDTKTIRIALVMLLGGFAYSSVLSFLASYTQENDIPQAASSFFLVYAAVVFASRLFMGRIQDRRGDNSVMYPTLVSFVIGLAIMSQADTTWLVLVAAVFIGFGFGAVMPCAQAIAIKMSPPHRVGLATSTFYLFLDIGTGIGPVILGLLIPVIGFSGMYLGLAGLMIFGVVMYYFLHHRREIA